MYDMSHIQKLAKFNDDTGETMQSFLAFDKAALSDGAIPKSIRN